MSKLLSTKVNEMTVGDSFKLQGATVAVFVTCYALGFGAVIAYSAISDRFYARKLRKENEVPETE